MNANPGRRRTSGALESEVLAALWAADRPLTPGEVAQAVDGRLAYTTVQTILTRLYGKGAVERRSAGRGHVYTAVLDEAGITASRMHSVLNRGGDYVTVLSRFVGRLSPAEEAALAAILAQSAQESQSGPTSTDERTDRRHR